MGFSGFDHNPAANAKQVSIPTLHLHGALDTNVTADQAQNVFESLAGPKQFVTFEEIGHESFPNRRPAEWETAVGQFLNTHLDEQN